MILYEETLTFGKETMIDNYERLEDVSIQAGRHSYKLSKKKANQPNKLCYIPESAQEFLPLPDFPTLPDIYISKRTEDNESIFHIEGVISESFRAVLLIIWFVICAIQLFIFCNQGVIEAIRNGFITPFLLGIMVTIILFLVAKRKGRMVSKDFSDAYRETIAQVADKKES